MKLEHVALRFGVCLLLGVGDRLFAFLALETNAAGALLSPGGAVDPAAFGIALGFLGCRLLFVLAFCGAVAWTARDAVGLALSSRART